MKKIYPLFLCFIVLAFNTGRAQYFVMTDSLNQPTINQQSQLLTGGGVLAFGGDDGTSSGPGTYAWAQIYSSGFWSITASMLTARTQFASVLLPNGNVLAMGGVTADLSYEWSSCEIYTPSPGGWAYTDSMPVATLQEGAVVLSSGNVLMADGDSSYIYTTTTGHWGGNAPMAAGHGLGPILSLLQNGKVLAVGGNDCLTCADVYDPTTNSWTVTANQLHYSRVQSTAILLNNGKVLVFGSSSIDSGQTTSELYDPATDSFTVSGNLLSNISNNPAVLLDNGNVLVWGLGNIFGSPGNYQTIQIYNVSNGTWFTVPANTLGTNNNTLVKLPGNQVLVIAGGELATAVPYCWLINGNLTGVNDIVPISNLNISPNPGNAYFTLGGEQIQQAGLMRVYDLQGNIALEIKQDWTKPVDASPLAPGQYIITLYDKNERTIGVQKWVKM